MIFHHPNRPPGPTWSRPTVWVSLEVKDAEVKELLKSGVKGWAYRPYQGLRVMWGLFGRGYGVKRVLIPFMWYGTRQGSPFNRGMSQASLFASISDFETSQNVISIAIIMNRNFLNKMGSLELRGIATCLSNGTPKNFSVTVLPFPSFWVGGYGQQTLQDLTHRRRVHWSLCLPGSSTLQGSSVWKGLEVLRCPSSTFKSSNVCCCRVAPLSLFEFSMFFVDDPRNNNCDKCMRWISSICVYYKSIFNWTYT